MSMDVYPKPPSVVVPINPANTFPANMMGGGTSDPALAGRVDALEQNEVTQTAKDTDQDTKIQDQENLAYLMGGTD